jgi:hypothetical protein
MQFESAVTEMYQKAFVGSSIENGTTVIQFDLRQLDFQRELGTTSPICWRQDVYPVDMHELSTFPNPIKYRFLVAQGSYLNAKQQRVYFTPDIQSPRCLDLPAYEQKHHPAVLLSGGGMRSQPQTNCADLFRLVPDSDYQVIDQKVD